MQTKQSVDIEVQKPGLATSIQDIGRQGFYHVGIPPSGSLDQLASQAANLLVGNSVDAAVLECTLLGPQLLFHTSAIVAITGAEMMPKVDGVAQRLNAALRISAGSVPSFDYVKSGARSYLAVSGGFDVPPVLGSRSTYTLGSIGGLNGRRLQKADTLRVGPTSGRGKEGVQLPTEFVREHRPDNRLRVLTGLYHHRLTSGSAKSFFEDTWSVSAEADRTGYRFKGGRPLAFKPRKQPFGAGADPSNIVDACYPIGSIQIPAGKEPIALHRDAVSGGGYATIGTIITADMDLIGQMQPNYKTTFVAVNMLEALEARKQYSERLAKLRACFS
ncbi:allophanate hydrolase [Caballeronia jiangsuensis]|nr:allophanate hydrolase [Caballeronia jiangsuensis]